MKEVSEGEIVSWGYGFCWFNYSRMTSTIAPVPFNFLFRWIRQLYLYLASPERSIIERVIHNKMVDNYSKGYEDGEKNTRAFTIREVGKALGKGIKGMEELIDGWKKEGYYFDR